MEEEIRAEFEGSGFPIGGDSAQILSTLLTYCVNYKMSPADLVSNWEVYYLNRLLSNTHTDEEGLLGTPSTKQEKPHGESSNSELTPLTTERPSSIRAAKTNGDRITPFAQRVNKFTQHYVLNADNVASLPSKDEVETSEDELIRRIPPSQKCTLQVQRSKPEPGCRFMYDRMEDRLLIRLSFQFNYLEDRIGRSARLFSATGLYGQPADATLASEENMFAVGMVICDGEGRLNEKSILLQGRLTKGSTFSSVEHSRGQRVRLDLKDINQFSLFSGQVVGIEGHNPSGHCFVASKLIDSIPVSVDDQLPCAKKQAVDHEGHQNSNTLSRVLSSVIAAGPFTTTDNLLFEPLQELLSYACRKQPQLLILMGPFIDSDHPEIKKGTSDQSFHDIFHFEILRKLQDFTQYLGHNVRVILVPSVRDAHHDAVFPQPAFDSHLPEDITQQITCLSNPSLFSSNEIQFGCCTVDILKQLSGDEISRKPPGGKAADRIGRLATHISTSYSYYPLYPPAAGVPMDFSLAKEALEIPSAPDVLLLPSDLAPSVKVLSVNEDTEEHKRFICVNPGRLSKGIGGGTFVELYYNEDTEKTKAFIMRI
uniref:DNA polymerase alpha subunit B n=1 Tax=Aegilops tauschii TaxID=37682 RepID=N1R461_AEGTA